MGEAARERRRRHCPVETLSPSRSGACSRAAGVRWDPAVGQGAIRGAKLTGSRASCPVETLKCLGSAGYRRIGTPSGQPPAAGRGAPLARCLDANGAAEVGSSRLGGGAQEGVEEEAVGGLGLGAVLGLEAEEHEGALAERDGGEGGATGELIAAEEPAAEQGVAGAVGDGGAGGTAEGEGWALLGEDGDILGGAEGQGIGGVGLGGEDGAGAVEGGVGHALEGILHLAASPIEERQRGLVEGDEGAAGLNEGFEVGHAVRAGAAGVFG